MGGCPSKENPTMEEIKSQIDDLTQERDTLKKNYEGGIRPEIIPTREELERARKKMQYNDRYVHLAIAGGSGSGKSSLINAFRGVRNGGRNSANTDCIETTMEIGRYPDPKYPMFAWYDIPGGGTSTVKDWRYFNDQGLFVFDIIIVVWNARFTEIDINILQNATRFKIPTFIVRSQSDMHIQNLVKVKRNLIEDNEDLTEEEKEQQLEGLDKVCSDQYVAKTRQNVQQNLMTKSLPLQKVYLVSCDGVFHKVRDTKNPKGVIFLEEKELVDDILKIIMGRPLRKTNPAHMEGEDILRHIQMSGSLLSLGTGHVRV